jgi:hypothetical protein
MHSQIGIALVFAPVIAGLSGIVLFARLLERVTTRVNPAASKEQPDPRRIPPRGTAAWFRYLGTRGVALAVFIALFTTTRLVAAALLGSATVAVGYVLYKRRIQPLRAMGATDLEALLLIAALVFSLASFGWFIYRAIQGFYGAALYSAA